MALINQAMLTVVMEAYLHAVSTHKVDDPVKALGADTDISKSEVSCISADLDIEGAALLDRSLTSQSFPYLVFDAAYRKAGCTYGWFPQAVIVTNGLTADGCREVLGFSVGDSEDGSFWTAFLPSLKGPRPS